MSVHCPLCGLRFARATELDEHARDDHAPPVVTTRESITVVRAHPRENGFDQVLRRRGAG